LLLILHNTVLDLACLASLLYILVQQMVKLLTNQDLADLMGWSVGTIHMRRYRGLSLPPSIVIDRTIRYRPEDVDDWLTNHTSTQERSDATATVE
jgi:predicted DNA-binding transcriptional regulator AlpA